MSARKMVRAEGVIPFGARVLVRGDRAVCAGADVANATAGERPRWCREQQFDYGQSLSVTMDAEIGTRSLQALANGPINDSNALYLPAGRLSMEDWRAREQRILAGLPA